MPAVALSPVLLFAYLEQLLMIGLTKEKDTILIGFQDTWLR